MNNWRLLLFGFFVILHISESFSERIVHGQQEYCDQRSNIRRSLTNGNHIFKSELRYSNVNNRRQSRESPGQESMQQRLSSTTHRESNSQSRQNLVGSVLRDCPLGREARSSERIEIDGGQRSFGGIARVSREINRRLLQTRIVKTVISRRNLQREERLTTQRTQTIFDATRRSGGERKNERTNRQNRFGMTRNFNLRDIPNLAARTEADRDRRAVRERSMTSERVLRSVRFNRNGDEKRQQLERRISDYTRDRTFSNALTQRSFDERNARKVRSASLVIRMLRIMQNTEDRRIHKVRRDIRTNKNREEYLNERDSRVSVDRRNQVDVERRSRSVSYHADIRDNTNVRANRETNRKEIDLGAFAMNKLENKEVYSYFYTNWQTYVFYAIQGLYLLCVFTHTSSTKKNTFSGKLPWVAVLPRPAIKVD